MLIYNNFSSHLLFRWRIVNYKIGLFKCCRNEIFLRFKIFKSHKVIHYIFLIFIFQSNQLSSVDKITKVKSCKFFSQLFLHFQSETNNKLIEIHIFSWDSFNIILELTCDFMWLNNCPKFFKCREDFKLLFQLSLNITNFWRCYIWPTRHLTDTIQNWFSGRLRRVFYWNSHIVKIV